MDDRARPFFLRDERYDLTRVQKVFLTLWATASRLVVSICPAFQWGRFLAFVYTLFFTNTRWQDTPAPMPAGPVLELGVLAPMPC